MDSEEKSLVKDENVTVRSKAVEAIVYFDKLETQNELYSCLKHKSRMSSHQKKVWEELPFFLR